ncbi:MAG: hypothetical protein JNK55_16765 [Rubrivivax sp.]|nr:hypothetical protein [Rubrivivax sp.]
METEGADSPRRGGTRRRQVTGREEAEAGTLRTQQLHAQGRLGEAVEEGLLTLTAWRALGDSRRECELLLWLVWALSDQGASAEALLLARHAFDAARAARLPSELERSLVAVAGLQGRLGDAAAAETLLLQALSRARELPDAQQVPVPLNALLATLLQAHEDQRETDPERALATAARLQRHARDALRWASQEPDAMRKAILLSNAGAALGVAGQPQEGIQRLRESLQLAEESGLRLVALRAAERLSGQLLHAGSVEQALALDPVLQEQLRPDDGPAVRESVHTARARLAEARGDAELAASMREAANRDRAERLAGAEAMRDAVSRLAGGVLRVLPEVDLEWAQRPGG